MAYVDPMGTAGARVARINDLSLGVTAPINDGGTVYGGNNGLDLDNVSNSGGVSNTVENAVVLDLEPGTWTIEVLADEVVEDAHLETPAVDADAALIIFPDRSTIFADGFESGDTSAWGTVAN